MTSAGDVHGEMYAENGLRSSEGPTGRRSRVLPVGAVSVFLPGSKPRGRSPGESLAKDPPSGSLNMLYPIP